MKILNIGSLNIDYTYHVDHIVQPKETMTAKNLHIHPGGKGLNQSIALARAGVEVFHAGMIGADGQFLIDVCKENNVHIDNIKIGTKRTGNAIIQVDKNGENSILLYSGANRCLEKEFIDQVLNDFGQGDILLLQNEVNLLDYIINKAYQRGMKIFLNPSPYDRFIEMCDLTKVDTFLINEIEGYQMTKEKDIQNILAVMKQLYPNSKVVLTCGEKGAYFQEDNCLIYQPAFKVKAIDTTAAGDTFTGYYISAMAFGKEAKEALYLASKAASLSVMKVGASSSIPFIQEVI